jgi:hypothetical protein
MILKKIKEKFRKNRSSSNYLWKGIFFIRDTTARMWSNVLDLYVMLFKEMRKFKVEEISGKKFEESNVEKYSYFGEFGYFQFSVLGGLSQYFQIYPNKKLEIITYENYGRILELVFPNNIKAYYTDYKFDEKYRACHYYHDREFRMSIRLLGFGKNVSKDLIYPNKKLSRIHFESGGDFFYHMYKPIKFPLDKRWKKRQKFISIFPRFRQTSTSRNLSKEQWDKIVEVLSKFKYPIVLHGFASEFIDLKNKNFVYPKNIYEQIAYLNNSIFCVTPFSGFQHFAENCGCDLFSILNPDPKHWQIFIEHEKFNPFGVKIYKVKENEDYLSKLRKLLKRKSS